MENDFDYETITILLADPENSKCRYFPVDIDMYNGCRQNEILSNATHCVLSARSDKSVTCDDYVFYDELMVKNSIFSATMQFRRLWVTHETHILFRKEAFEKKRTAFVISKYEQTVDSIKAK